MSGKILKEVFETKLLFKQRLFSWFDSYDIYDETEQTVYVVKGQLAWGHCLKIFSVYGEEVGTVKEKVLTLLPKFEVYEKERYIGCIQKELTFLKPKYDIDFNGSVSSQNKVRMKLTKTQSPRKIKEVKAEQ